MRSLALCLFALIAATPLVASAETYFLGPLTGSNVSAEELQSVTELVRMAVQGTEGATLTDDEKAADAVLSAKVLKLGTAYVLGMSKIKNGKVVAQQQQRSKSIEDMDTVATRVARAVINDVKVEKDVRVGDVTEDEVTRGTRRIEPTSQWFVGFGPTTSKNLGTDNSGVYANLGHSWGLDPHFALTLGGEMVSIKKAFVTNFAVGGDVFFTDHNLSPFASVGFGYAIVNPNDEGAFLVSAEQTAGWTLSVGAGLRFFRASRVNLGLSAKYIHVLKDMAAGQPSAALAAITIYY